MTKLTLLPLLFATVFFTSSLSGCANEDIETNCAEGGDKCDYFEDIQDLRHNYSKLDLDALASMGVGFSAKALNTSLSLLRYVDITLGRTEFFALTDTANRSSDPDHRVHDIEELLSGLGARYGEKELSHEVNKVRTDYLRHNEQADAYFAESYFHFALDSETPWSVLTKGFGKELTVESLLGFDVKTAIEARVIGAYAKRFDASIDAPLKAIKEVRGFIFPESLDDIKRMKPGESFALQGNGVLGANLGIGVPILVANPASLLTYSIMVTAGTRTRLKGLLDIQLVRLDDDKIVIDIGMSKAALIDSYLGLEDGWGVQGLLQSHVEIGGIKVNLGKLLDLALSEQLTEKLNLVDGRIGYSEEASRISVSRMRFDMSKANETLEMEEAIAQALLGDIRLAQGLSAKGAAGVKSEFDLLRSGVSKVRYARLDILGMRFFTTNEHAEGTATIQTPGGVTSLFFDTLREAGGSFFGSHGYGRTGLAGVVFDAGEDSLRSEANLFITAEEGDKFFREELLADHADGLLLSLGGFSLLEAIEKKTNHIQRLITQTCPTAKPGQSGGTGSTRCNQELLGTSKISEKRTIVRELVAKLRNEAIAIMENSIDEKTSSGNGLSDSQGELLMQAFKMKLAAQSISPSHAIWSGPSASFVLDYRLDDIALERIFESKNSDDFKTSVTNYLLATQVDRKKEQLTTSRDAIRKDLEGELDEIGIVFDTHRKNYSHRLKMAKARFELLGEKGFRALEVHYTIDKDKVPQYEKATSTTVEKSRSLLLTQFYDDLREAADSIGRAGTSAVPYSEQIVAYGLLGITSPEQLDVRASLQLDTSVCFICPTQAYDAAGYEAFDIRAIGDNVSPIGGTLFDLDSIIKMKGKD